jgi:hypothetical protein
VLLARNWKRKNIALVDTTKKSEYVLDFFDDCVTQIHEIFYSTAEHTKPDQLALQIGGIMKGLR